MRTLLHTIFGVSFFVPVTASAHICDYTDGYGTYGMMGYGGGMGILFSVAIIAWIVVGVLVSLFLWQKINKKSSERTEK